MLTIVVNRHSVDLIDTSFQKTFFRYLVTKADPIKPDIHGINIINNITINNQSHPPQEIMFIIIINIIMILVIFSTL